MNARTLDSLRRSLVARGYRSDLTSPNGTMTFAETYLSGIEIAELLETLVTRREKIYRSVDVVGQQIAKDSHDDVVAAIDAAKEVIGSLTAPEGGQR